MIKAYFGLPLKHLAEIKEIHKTEKSWEKRRMILIDRNIIVGVFFRPFVLAGLALYFISALFWVRVLSAIDLSIAYPMLAISYIFSYLAGVFLLGEKARWQGIVGILIVLVGLIFLGSALQQSRVDEKSDEVIDTIPQQNNT